MTALVEESGGTGQVLTPPPDSLRRLLFRAKQQIHEVHGPTSLTLEIERALGLLPNYARRVSEEPEHE